MIGKPCFVKLEKERENGRNTFIECDEVGNVILVPKGLNKNLTRTVHIIKAPYDGKLIPLLPQLDLFGNGD